MPCIVIRACACLLDARCLLLRPLITLLLKEAIVLAFAHAMRADGHPAICAGSHHAHSRGRAGHRAQLHISTGAGPVHKLQGEPCDPLAFTAEVCMRSGGGKRYVILSSALIVRRLPYSVLLVAEL